MNKKAIVNNYSMITDIYKNNHFFFYANTVSMKIKKKNTV